MTSARALPLPTEHEEQATLVEWAEVAAAKLPELHLLFAIPNGAALASKNTGSGRRSRFSRQGAKLRAEGMKSGVPDLCLPVARGQYHGLFIEMKRTKGGMLSPEQKEWLHRLADQGYCAIRCNGWWEARTAILQYLTREVLIEGAPA
ncbi:VRR-NUC domain-containing protein [Luteibacter yeojuensis]|uniref:VRR-NUC domain-containing protein n=1 Tax=Luteibacter yeojuensis TaxID=345309 RepID=A0A7X5QU01_9GAMM|nr:VRR-NUC domain-containing protein [Luteibacter yeojuensis]NID15403.1 VRR-NUC domain-containing protein [Luteibacter yeojuensis]